MWWFLIKSILPILISLISLSISIFTATKNFRDERFDLDFDLIKWFVSSTREDLPDHLWLTITNNSKLPCSILEISVVVEDLSGNIARGIGRGNKALVATSYTHRNGKDEEKKETYSLDYPQNIDAYSSLGGYFHFYSSHFSYHFEEKNAKVTIKTNRGSVTKKIFLDMGKNVFRVIQNKDLGEGNKVMHRGDGSQIVYINDGI